MKIDLNEIWHTKIAVATGKIAENYEMLEGMGISTTIDDDEVQWVEYWIPYRWIKCVEATNHGDFNIELRDGTIINSKENPFERQAD